MSLHGKLIKHCSYPFLAKREGVSMVLNEMKLLDKSQYFSPEQLQELQLAKIKKMLIHAYANCSLYRSRFESIGFDPSSFHNFEEFLAIQPLTKKDLQSDLPGLIAGNYAEDEIHKDATGGSTGNHTPFFRDNQCLALKKAVEYRCNQWAGWDIGEKIAYYWPAIQDFAQKKSWKAKIKNQLFHRSLMLYSGRQNEEILQDHYKRLAAFRPVLLRTFPNPLATLAKYIQTTGKPVIHIPSIICVGEPLLDSHRKLFADVFGAEAHNCYVSRECGNMACECGLHPGSLHVNAEMVYIEPLVDSSANEKEPVKFLITDLTNFGMPFIRYQIEDLGVFRQEKCACGRGLPLVSMEAGRASDFLISPHDRSKISGCSLLHHLIAEGPEVGQIQLIQDRINHMIFKIVKSDAFRQEKLAHFDKVVYEIFKGQMEYDIEYVDKIEREKSKKYFFTKCLVSESD